MFRKILKHTPAACAFAILALQMAIPWVAPHLVTSDGPSHLYGAIVARDLLFNHQHSVYSAVYTIQRSVIPNWMTTIVLAAADAVAGPDDAEKLFASLLILLGFLGLCYVNRALDPDRSPWTPLMNFAAHSWFLWVGFYNFYLGMVLLPFLVGFHIRGTGRLTGRRAVITALGLVVLFFTHLIAVVLAISTLFSITAWMAVLKKGQPLWRRFSELGILCLSCLPAVILILIYIHGAPPAKKVFEFATQWRQFPMHNFWTGQGNYGHETMARILVLCYLAASVLLMTRMEWASARAGLLVATLIAFAGFMLIPDSGFGGAIVKLRFAWAVFILGCPLAASVSRLRYLGAPFALGLAFLLSQNAIATAKESRRLSHAANSYLAASDSVAPNATLIRLHYQAPGAPALYGFDGNSRFPYSHLDSLAAARNNDIDMTDYEALSELFPVVYKKPAREVRLQLWGFEGPGPGDEKTLTWIENGFPIPVDFVLAFGDECSSLAMNQGMPDMLSDLDAQMKLISTSSDGLLRVYRRIGFKPRKL